MATVVLGGVGAAIGGAVGGPAGARLGFSIGAVLAGALFPPKQPAQSRGRIDDLKLTGSQFGAMIPIIRGCFRAGCNIIDASDLKEVVSKRKQGGKGTKRQTVKTYSYFVDLAAIVCEGPIGEIRRIWAEDRLIYDVSVNPKIQPSNIRTWIGTFDQAVDPVLEILHGVGNTPAYRGRAGFSIDEFDTSPYGNRIPAFTAEACPLPALAVQALNDGAAVVYIFNESSGNLINQITPGTFDLSVDAAVVRQAVAVVAPDKLAYDFSSATGSSPLFGHVEGTRPDFLFDKITIEVVGKFNTPSGTARTILNCQRSGGITNIGLTQLTAGDLRAAVNTTTGGTNTQTLALGSANEHLPYAHYVWQWDNASGKHKGYRNAVEKYNVTHGSGTITDAAPRNTAIGGVFGIGTSNSDSFVDVIAFYPNVLLNTEQIANHHAVAGV